jgi:polyhydroxybutyrate depolymerase
VRPRWRALLASAALLGLAACAGSSDAGAPTTTAADDASADAGAAGATASTTTSMPPKGTRGCGTPADAATLGEDSPGDVPLTFESGGVERVYRLSVPPSYDPDAPAPLIFNLHGSGSNAIQASVYGDVPKRAAEKGYLVVTPEAIDGTWELGGTGADGDFLIGLLDDIEARYCVDQQQTHIMGMSLGAWKAAATACSFPGRFASAVLVTVEVYPGDCEPLSVLAFHGTGDHVVPYGEGADPGITVTGFNAKLPGAVDNIEKWAASGGCDPEPKVSEIGDDVVRRRFSGCDPGIDVELYTIKGGDHTWPGADIDISGHGGTTQTIDATDLALAWFADHPAG